MSRKIAVVLLNLGGPDRPESVQPFLFNLFNDKAIIAAPQPIRWLIAKLISTRRAPVAREIYEHLGGKSPLLELTQAQAQALENALSGDNSGAIYKVFIAMRYWHPMSAECVSQVKSWGADEVLLLPLYPQFSTTTTGSSFAEWERRTKAAGLKVPVARIGCYPTQPDFIKAHANLLAVNLAEAKKFGQPRVLFSAHGLPQKVVDAGDPYQWQVEKTAAAILEQMPQGTDEGGQQADPAMSPRPVPQSLGEGGSGSPCENQEIFTGQDKIDYTVCYQSKVGPLKWLEPSTEAEIMRAGRDGVPLVIVPIAFVSEHSETLVELDIEYRNLAKQHGVPAYFRVPALGVQPNYIEGLKKICLSARKNHTASHTGDRLCPPSFAKCLCRDGF